ncbi:MAG TPA: potassium transporter Kup [Caulobacteraceae bacterium]
MSANATTIAAPPSSEGTTSSHAHAARPKFMGLALGSIGVVFGDIGTSPLYAFHDALAQAGGVRPDAIVGVVSLALWALILVVTVKYVIVIMRADNKGEGGILSLMALAQRAVGQRNGWIFFLGVCGAALFYGDALITPSISVLSAIEGLRSIPHIGPHVTLTVVLITSLVILIALFVGQSYGTARVAGLFGPICLVWLISIAVLGVLAFTHQPRIFAALNPWMGARFLLTHGMIGFFVLGSVFLTVTGAEALYADMGHFGRWPIQAAWLFLVLPCLALNYLGQGGFALTTLAASHGHLVGDHSWFYEMAPAVVRAPLVVIAALATIIASQAVITGSYSLTSQAIQLGLLPRLEVRQTSESHSGQIYMPQVNIMLAIGVVLLVAIFKTSGALAMAYGIAVSGTMAVTTSLAFIVMWKLWKWPLICAIAVAAPLVSLDLVFLSANLMRIFEGGFVPVLLGLGMFIVMYTWTRGTTLLAAKTSQESPPLKDFARLLAERQYTRVKGTAVFLTSDVERTPAALLHNLKHNQVLHEQNIIMTVRTADTPRVPASARLQVETIDASFKTMVATFGFMESPNVPEALRLGRSAGVSYSHMLTSFFLGRRTVVAAARHSLMPRWQDRLFILMMKNAAAPTDFFHIPAGRVVEMGSQVTV